MHALDGALRFPGRIGLGTWEMGVGPGQRPQEIAAVKHALDVGYRVLDTAEMYADGGAERVIGGALQEFGAARRAELFIVSKVLPQHASRAGTIRACEASIARMGCDYLDMYLLHWRGAHPFRETLRGFDELRRRGLIRHYGVSNLDVADLAHGLESETALALAPPRNATRSTTAWSRAASNLRCCRGSANAASRPWPMRRWDWGYWRSIRRWCKWAASAA